MRRSGMKGGSLQDYRISEVLGKNFEILVEHLKTGYEDCLNKKRKSFFIKKRDL